MEWFAYLIWGGLTLCLIYAVVSYRIASRRSVMPAVAAAEATEEEEVVLPVIDGERWQRLVEFSCGEGVVWPEDVKEQLRWASHYLGVDEHWLCGDDVAMYPCLSFHNAVADAVEFIDQRQTQGDGLRLLAVKPQGVILDETVYEASVVLCFCQPVVLDGGRAWRYFPVNVYWEWGYPPEQMQCRQILYLAKCAGCEILGIESDLDGIYELLEGITLPAAVQLSTLEECWPAGNYAQPGQQVGGLTDCHLDAEQLTRMIEGKHWPVAEPGTC